MRAIWSPQLLCLTPSVNWCKTISLMRKSKSREACRTHWCPAKEISTRPWCCRASVGAVDNRNDNFPRCFPANGTNRMLLRRSNKPASLFFPVMQQNTRSRMKVNNRMSSESTMKAWLNWPQHAILNSLINANAKYNFIMVRAWALAHCAAYLCWNADRSWTHANAVINNFISRMLLNRGEERCC